MRGKTKGEVEIKTSRRGGAVGVMNGAVRKLALLYCCVISYCLLCLISCTQSSSLQSSILFVGVVVFLLSVLNINQTHGAFSTQVLSTFSNKTIFFSATRTEVVDDDLLIS